MRALGFAVWAGTVTAMAWWTAAIAWLLDPVRGRLADYVLRLWGRALVAGAGQRVVVEGLEHTDPTKPRILVANHASWLDPCVMARVSPGPLRYVLKHELTSVPFIGWHCWLAGHYLIDRDDPRKGLALLEKAVLRLKRHPVNLVVFPEGTRSADGRLAALRGGAVMLAMASGLELQPVAILGTHEIMGRGAAYPRFSGTIRVRFGPAIPSGGARGGAGRRALTAAIRRALLDLGVPDGVGEPPEAVTKS